MLARSAQGLYWMGRYMERADHLCRLLRLQTEALVDRPIAEIYNGWNRIYSCLDRQPPGANLGSLPGFEPDGGDGVLLVMGIPGSRAWQSSGGDEYTLADSFTLADDLTFERSNPSSVFSCFALGRENARQVRHSISAEMWRSVNLAYLRIQRVNILDIWNTSPETFYDEIDAAIDNFMGVAAATMYRDEGWHFLQLGRFIERAQVAAALFLAQIEQFPVDDSDLSGGSESDWVTLLRMYHAVGRLQPYLQRRNRTVAGAGSCSPPTRCSPIPCAGPWTWWKPNSPPSPPDPMRTPMPPPADSRGASLLWSSTTGRIPPTASGC